MSDNCTNYGGTDFTSALLWALDNGAVVVNFSVGPTTGSAIGSPQNSADRFFDYTAINPPYPFNVVIAGNYGLDARVLNNIRNGLVVGGSNDHGTTSRSDATMFDLAFDVGSDSGNHEGATGYEVPHLVAPAVAIDTAGSSSGSVATDTGTSLAAPQVAGIAASIMEMNPAVRWWPEVMMAGLMASADRNVDGAQGGVFPLDLDDEIDDHDGAGLINAENARLILQASSKRSVGQAAASRGHDYGMISTSAMCQGQYLASVAPRQRLRVVSQVAANPVCNFGSSPDEDDCATSSFAPYFLAVYEGTQLIDVSFAFNANYKYATAFNSSYLTTRTYRIQFCSGDWGPGQHSFGIAWSRSPW
jgi:hypothetical protein